MSTVPTPVFGIHIGNSLAGLSVCSEPGKSSVIANEAGDRLTPCVAYWSPSALTVGKAGEIEGWKNPGSLIKRNKQLLNNDISDEELERLCSKSVYKIHKTTNGIKYEVLFNGTQHHVYMSDIAVAIFKKMYNIAATMVPKRTTIRAVICVPSYFSTDSIESVQSAAVNAGFNILQVIDEPCAAVLGTGFNMENENKKQYVFVYRLGGVTMDITILECIQGMYTIVESLHKYDVGGEYFTAELMQFLIQEFKRQYKSGNVVGRGLYKMANAAEQAKLILSTLHTANCNVESVDGFDFNFNVSRPRFENLISGQLNDCVNPVGDLLKKANLNAGDIHKVVLCGGSVKIPKLQAMVKNIFPEAQILGAVDSQELIATGAGLQAGYTAKCTGVPVALSHEVNFLEYSLKIQVESESDATKFEVNADTVLPIHKKFSVTKIGDGVVVLSVYINNKKISTVSQDGHTVVAIVDVSKKGNLVLKLRSDDEPDETTHSWDLGALQDIINS